MLHDIYDPLQHNLVMIPQGLIKQHLHQVLYGFCRIFIVLLLLKIVFLKLLDHLLPPCPELAIELYHGHVLDDQVICAALLVLLVSRIFVLVLICCSGGLHGGEFGLLVLLELVLHYVLLNFALLGQADLHGVAILLGAVQEVVLVDHLEDRRDVV